MEKELFLLKSGQRISLKQALDYEIHGHWLTFWIWGFSWGQRFMTGYALWKVKRKHKRYQWAGSLSLW